MPGELRHLTLPRPKSAFVYKTEVKLPKTIPHGSASRGVLFQGPFSESAQVCSRGRSVRRPRLQPLTHWHFLFVPSWVTIRRLHVQLVAKPYSQSQRVKSLPIGKEYELITGKWHELITGKGHEHMDDLYQFVISVSVSCLW